MTRRSDQPNDAVEPELRSVSFFDVRHADSDIDGLVAQIVDLLADGVTLVDLSHHDHRGTVIELRAQPSNGVTP